MIMKIFTKLLLLPAFFTFGNFIQAQTKKAGINSKPKISKKVVKSKVKKASTKIISAGVVNGKAINFVRPQYPATAKAVQASGSVSVQILIDETGAVEEAKIVGGNIFLQHAALKAAKLSTFEPFTLGGERRKVSGIIVYNFISDAPLNWLEIGFKFESPSYLYFRKITEVLPLGFSEEIQLLQENDFDKVSEPVISSIESKISSDDKKLWLFSVGRILGKISERSWDRENRIVNMKELQPFLLSIPENISRRLVEQLQQLSSIQETEEFNKKMVEIYQKLSFLAK